MGMFDERVDEYAMEVIRLLDKESDRGCVLVTSAYIEDAVRRLLFAHCRTISDVKENELNSLFKTFDSQFANFASCIRLCRALGLIDEEDQSILRDFGVWRNKFAHGTGDKRIELEGIASFIAPIESNLERATTVVIAGDTWFAKHSFDRQKFMVWAALILAGFQDHILELEDHPKKPPRSPDAKAE